MKKEVRYKMAKVNLNKWAKEITLDEGLKKSLSIAQVKEVLHIVLHDLKQMPFKDIISLLTKMK